MSNERVHPRGERGIALVSAMLFLLLGAVLVASTLTLSTGERRISSNVHTARRAVYAADAGARTLEQVVANVARARLDSLVGANAGGPVIPTPTTLFAGAPLTLTCSNPAFSANATISFIGNNVGPNSQSYDYRYTVFSTGEDGMNGERNVVSTGTLRLSAERGSFTDYLMYTNRHTSASGGSIWFTTRTQFDGRVHTNGKLRFAFQPRFDDAVSSVSQTAWYYNERNGSSNPLELDADHNSSVDVPTFGGGFSRGVPNVSLPANAYGQMNAALGLNAANTTNPDATTINTQLGLGNGALPPSDGVYLANTAGALTGGLFVQGELDKCLLAVDALGRQVYVLHQGGSVDSVIVDRGANTTRQVHNGVPTTFTGVPLGILYVTGGIDDLRGPDRNNGNVVPALAQQTKLLITAEDDIVLRRDVTCKDFDLGTNVLGIYSAEGSVRVGSGAPNDMHLDAFVMAAGDYGVFAVDDYDNRVLRGMFHLRGGMVSEYYGAFGQFNGSDATSGYGRNFVYDNRGLIPPYFPSTSRFTANNPTPVRESWREM